MKSKHFTELLVLSGLLGCTLFWPYMFLRMMEKGRIILAEPIKEVLYIEFVMSIWFVIFGIIFLIRRIHQMHKENL